MGFSRDNKLCEGRYSRGVAATEFALVAPILILFALGSMDFGRISFFAEVVSNAARSGAETGGTRQFTSDTEAMWKSKVQDAVLQEMQNIPKFQKSELQTNVTTNTDPDGITRVTVDLIYPFRTLVAWPGLPSEVRLHERVQYRQFR